MTVPMKIEFVSDVSCPWCVIGLRGLEEALGRLDGLVDAEIRFEPFELNPDMPSQGQNIVEHVGQKYGSTPEQSGAARQTIAARAAEVGFTMKMNSDSRIYNTFDAHRLLHWASLQGRQRALKHALFEAYFTEGANMSDHDTLARAAQSAGLDPDAAADVLDSGLFGDEVRAAELHWRREGISAVPAAIINGRYLISGGHPAAAFEKALRAIAEESLAEAVPGSAQPTRAAS